MGALKGNVTVRRYVVRGEIPRDRARLVKGIRAHALIPIDPASTVEKTHGWAMAEDPDVTDLSSEKIFFGNAAVLALRTDTLRPPSAVVKRLVAEKLRALGRKAGRREKQAAKEEVTRSLRSRAFPTTRAYDLVWQIDEGRAFFWSHAKGANDVLTELFAKSFGLELAPFGPTLVAGRGALPPGLEPTPELVFGFPGLPGRSNESDEDEAGAEGEGVDA